MQEQVCEHANTAKDNQQGENRLIYYMDLSLPMKQHTLDVVHYPTLKTVLQVEDVLRKADTYISKNELKRRLKTKIMHQTLNIILAYLEDGNKILMGPKGIIWIWNENPKFKRLLAKAVRVA